MIDKVTTLSADPSRVRLQGFERQSGDLAGIHSSYFAIAQASTDLLFNILCVPGSVLYKSEKDKKFCIVRYIKFID